MSVRWSGWTNKENRWMIELVGYHLLLRQSIQKKWIGRANISISLTFLETWTCSCRWRIPAGLVSRWRGCRCSRTRRRNSAQWWHVSAPWHYPLHVCSQHCLPGHLQSHHYPMVRKYKDKSKVFIVSIKSDIDVKDIWKLIYITYNYHDLLKLVRSNKEVHLQRRNWVPLRWYRWLSLHSFICDDLINDDL